jgi:HAD superfamily hydrolase (TIGR01450 family)
VSGAGIDAAPKLGRSDRPLAQIFDVGLLDLDGVVYVGKEPVPGVPQALAAARQLGLRLAFVTNNAARPPEAVAALLSGMGVRADRSDVITSAQAAAHYLAERLPQGSGVLVVGTTGLVEALRERGLVPVFSADDDPAAVVQGYSPDLNWAQLAEGAVAIRRGLPWVATNVDPTVPSVRGPLPGNGSMVAALRHATGVEPTVTGKPDPTMHRETVERSHAERPVVVGDRLDTDIEGASAVGCPSLLVLSGVTTPGELLAAEPRFRPTFIAPDAGGLLTAHPPTTIEGATITCGNYQVVRDGGELLLSVSAGAEASADGLDALRALCSANWTSGGPPVRLAGSDGRATRELDRLGLG